ncbi:hypothetical protein [Actinomyces wuliandei]|uniref:hypothetical protein n=1 Tax=Actinomyces wuliandei TaxID=2057743 RepID=UPI00111B6C49|nr:hypothetical protein [Actinomyces wuliandei]
MAWVPPPLPVVTQEDTTTVVLEGNRRVTCLKLLHDPHLAPTKEIQESFQDLTDSTTTTVPRSISVIAYDSRQEYDDFLEMRHTADGAWVPAPYVPGTAAAPAPGGAGAAGVVAGAGFEPATSGLWSGLWLRAASLARAVVVTVQYAQVLCHHRLRCLHYVLSLAPAPGLPRPQPCGPPRPLPRAMFLEETL